MKIGRFQLRMYHIRREKKMKTGFKNLDNIVKIKGGNLIIVASRPAMGKTTLAQNILSNVAIKKHKPTAFFSLEESMEKIVNKLIIRTAMVEADKFKIYDIQTRTGIEYLMV